ncbi:Hypothetical protein CINCED_3A008334, partial [Cinara cedri]
MKLLEFIYQTTVLMIFISKQAQSTQYVPETEFLINLVSYVDNIKTLESFSRFNPENSNKQPSTVIESVIKHKNKMNKYLHNAINDKMNDLDCTYAHYAKFHLDIIHMILDLGLFSALKFEVVEKLKSLYLNVAMRAFFTFFNFNFEPPEWMWTFINFLETEYYSKKFHKRLSDIMIILTQVTTRTVCSRTKISWFRFLYDSSLMPSKRNFKAMDLKELHEEILYLNRLYIWCSTNNSSHRVNHHDTEIFLTPEKIQNDTIKMSKIY